MFSSLNSDFRNAWNIFIPSKDGKKKDLQLAIVLDNLVTKMSLRQCID